MHGAPVMCLALRAWEDGGDSAGEDGEEELGEEWGEEGGEDGGEGGGEEGGFTLYSGGADGTIKEWRSGRNMKICGSMKVCLSAQSPHAPSPARPNQGGGYCGAVPGVAGVAAGGGDGVLVDEEEDLYA